MIVVHITFDDMNGLVRDHALPLSFFESKISKKGDGTAIAIYDGEKPSDRREE